MNKRYRDVHEHCWTVSTVAGSLSRGHLHAGSQAKLSDYLPFVCNGFMSLSGSSV